MSADRAGYCFALAVLTCFAISSLAACRPVPVERAGVEGSPAVGPTSSQAEASATHERPPTTEAPSRAPDEPDVPVERTRSQERDFVERFVREHLLHVQRTGAGGVAILTDGHLRANADDWAFTLGISDTMRSVDHHAGRRYELAEIGEDGIELVYESTFDHRSFGKNLLSIDRGRIFVPYREGAHTPTVPPPSETSTGDGTLAHGDGWLALPPAGGPMWYLDSSTLDSDPRITFAVHGGEHHSQHYTALVYSLSARPGSGLHGPLVLADSVHLVDDAGTRYPMAVSQVHSREEDLVLGSVSFLPLTQTARSATLVIPALTLPDSSEALGPWTLDLLTNAQPEDAARSLSSSNELVAPGVVTHTLATGQTTVEYLEIVVDEDPARPAATASSGSPGAPLTPRGAAAYSTSPAGGPSETWQAQGEGFRLRVQVADASRARYLHATFVPHSGLYGMRKEDVGVP